MTTPVDRYTQLEAALSLANLDISVSEVHGIVVGTIANHLKTSQAPQLLSLIEPNADAAKGSLSPVADLLNELYRENSELLLEAKEGFELLLPTEDELLSTRVDGLAAWSRGYMLGLLYNDAFSMDQLPENGAEIARDIMQISEAFAGSDDEQEEDWALAELHEYVKVGVQLIFEFIYSERASATPQLQQ